MYYGLRGLSLIYLPYSDFGFYELAIFAVFYGLDWIATVPPTLTLIQENFGTADSRSSSAGSPPGTRWAPPRPPPSRGWMHSWQGNYIQAFVIAGFTGLVAAVISLLITRPGKDAGCSPQAGDAL